MRAGKHRCTFSTGRGCCPSVTAALLELRNHTVLFFCIGPAVLFSPSCAFRFRFPPSRRFPFFFPLEFFFGSPRRAVGLRRSPGGASILHPHRVQHEHRIPPNPSKTSETPPQTPTALSKALCFPLLPTLGCFWRRWDVLRCSVTFA